ncbi:MAG TPA: preprotein translocase subunit SecE [Mycobacteriales bacterium]|nr:preprotein translocase subunit SecE [Mycobacteriales bacterium]
MTQTAERPAQPTPAAGGRGARGPVGRVSLYYKQVIAELRKVIWPTRSELITYTLVSLVFVTAMILIVAGFDYLFGKAVLSVFG